MLRYQTLKENSETILKEVNITLKGITKDNNKLLYSPSFNFNSRFIHFCIDRQHISYGQRKIIHMEYFSLDM